MPQFRMPRFSKRKTSVPRAISCQIGIDHVSSPPKRAKSRNSRGTWRYFMDHSGVVKHVKTDSERCSGWILHWTEVGLQVPTYEVEPVGTCRFLGQILRCGLVLVCVCCMCQKQEGTAGCSVHFILTPARRFGALWNHVPILYLTISLHTCEGKMDIKTSLQQVQQVSCFLHFQT